MRFFGHLQSKYVFYWEFGDVTNWEKFRGNVLRWGSLDVLVIWQEFEGMV